MNDLNATIFSQFANSPTLVALIESMNAYIDPTVDINLWYDRVWNVLANGATLSDYGLDLWGRIVNVGRTVNVPADTPNPGGYAFTPGPYRLDNATYRGLILCKALANITNCTAASLNQLLTALFAGRGRCYVLDTYNMTMQYTFEFWLQPFEYCLVMSSGVVPHPVGVQSNLFQVDVDTTFGFYENVNLQPFDHGTFYNP